MAKKSFVLNSWHALLTNCESWAASSTGVASVVPFSRIKLPPSIAKAQLQQSCCISSDNSPRGGDHHGKGTNRGGKSNVRVPRLLYIQQPLKYLKNRWDLLKLKLFWDFSFRRKEFFYGARKALVVVTDFIRNQNAMEIHDVTTTSGFKQITRDMILSRTDPRISLMKFRMSDIRTAITAKVFLIRHTGRKHCMIDMFFVGMRNVSDFDTQKDLNVVSESVRMFDKTSANGRQFNPDRIIFSEVYVRFYREYTQGAPEEWSVALFKVLNFDIL